MNSFVWDNDTQRAQTKKELMKEENNNKAPSKAAHLASILSAQTNKQKTGREISESVQKEMYYIVSVIEHRVHGAKLTAMDNFMIYDSYSWTYKKVSDEATGRGRDSGSVVHDCFK